MLLLREATDNDLTIMMAWRSNPLLYEHFYQQTEPLRWEEHLSWWKSRNKDWRTFIIVLYQQNRFRDIGVITLGQLDHWSPEIGYYIGETTLWKQGYGKEAVNLALDWLREHGYKHIHTTIKVDNKASIKLAESVGFIRGMEARPNELYYYMREL